MRIDLHVHSTASDGSLEPEELVSRACAMGLRALSITDHDSVDAVARAQFAAEERNLLLIPGVELSTLHAGRDVHVLGYFVDIGDPSFLRELMALRDARRERAASIVKALRDAGYHVTLDEVLLLAEGGSVGRSHVARALVEKGHAHDIADAFQRLIGRDRPFYVPKPVAEPTRVIHTITQSGGLAVLAHPGVTGIDSSVPELVQAGLAGIEAFHSQHSREMRVHYVHLAEELGLIVTGGSDFHGDTAPGGGLGAVSIPDTVLPALFERAGRTLSA